VSNGGIQYSKQRAQRPRWYSTKWRLMYCRRACEGYNRRSVWIGHGREYEEVKYQEYQHTRTVDGQSKLQECDKSTKRGIAQDNRSVVFWFVEREFNNRT
jgi:hypothetical protein